MIPLRQEVSELTGIRAGIVLRPQRTGHPSGFSIAPAAAFSPREARLNRRILAAHLGLPGDAIRTMRQLHGTRVVRRYRRESETVDRDVSTDPAADAQWTSDAGVVLVALAADCCPVVLTAPSRGSVCPGVIGIAHAGRRGIVDGVVPALLDELIDAGVDPGDVAAWIGPCAGAGEYEVGSEVAALFQRYPSAVAPACHASDRFLLDLRGVLRIQLQSRGVMPERISRSSGATIAETRYHSHRRDHIRAGRMAAYVVQ